VTNVARYCHYETVLVGGKRGRYQVAAEQVFISSCRTKAFGTGKSNTSPCHPMRLQRGDWYGKFSGGIAEYNFRVLSGVRDVIETCYT
jgi:hypothetical protein